MLLEEQVCSLELAKRLKELGVKQESYFYWSTDNHTNYFVDNEETYPIDAHYPRPEIVCSAFTVAELGEMLPWFIEKESKNYWYGAGKTRKNDKYYSEHEVHYSDNETTPCLERDNNEANARAKMLIYLLENGLITLNKASND